MEKKFSLVIALAPERKAEVLESLKNLDYSKSEFHIIVVKGKNPSENRNKGAEKAKGEIIGFIDNDAVVDENLLKNAEEFFKKYPEIDIVGGPQLTPKDEKGFAKISGYALSSKFGAWNLSKRYSLKNEILDADETSITSANLFVKKNVTEKIKFDENLWPGEDPKFIEDAKKAGFKVAYSPNLIVYHRRRPTLKSLMKQIFSYGKTRPQKEKFIKTLKRPFFLIPSLFIIYLVLLTGSILISSSITGAVVGTKINKIGFLLFLPLIAYIFLAILFAIYDSLKNKDLKTFFILSFIFLIIHLSYGTGMIYGYIRKIKFFKKNEKDSLN